MSSMFSSMEDPLFSLRTITVLSMCKYPLRGGDERGQRLLGGAERAPLTLRLREDFIFPLRCEQPCWTHLAAPQTCPNLPDPQGVHRSSCNPRLRKQDIQLLFWKIEKADDFFSPGSWPFSFSLCPSLHMPLTTNA